MNKKNRHSINLSFIYPLLLCLISAATYYYCFDPKVYLGGDNIYYFNLGQAIAEGKGYITLSHPDTPLASHYPPGYPLLIAFIMTLFSQNIFVVKVFNGLFFLGSVTGSYFLFNKLSSNLHLSFVGGFLIAFNPVILDYSAIMMSEIPFLLFSILTLLLFINSDQDKSPYQQYLFYAFIICLSFTYHIKALGIALFAGIILYLMLNQYWKWTTATMSSFLILGLPWIIRQWLIGTGNSYLKQLIMVNPYRPELGNANLSDIVYRILNNLQYYLVVEIPDGMFPLLQKGFPSFTPADWGTGFIICFLLILGIIKLKYYSSLVGTYLLSFFGILLLWPVVWSDVRFLVPILPFLLFCFATGLYHLIYFAFKKVGYASYIHPLFLLIVVIYFIPSLQKQKSIKQRPYPEKWKNYIQIAEWAKENTHPNAIISCRKPALFYLFSDRKSFRFKDTPNKEVLLQNLKKRNTDYVVLDQIGFSSTKRYLIPTIKEYHDYFKTVFKVKDSRSCLLKFEPYERNNDQ